MLGKLLLEYMVMLKREVIREDLSLDEKADLELKIMLVKEEIKKLSRGNNDSRLRLH